MTYLDYAAATPADPAVIEVVHAAMRDSFANTKAPHALGKEASALVAGARSVISESIGALADELYFTSGGTDANARAILGAVNALQDSGRALSDMHIIASAVEHTSVRSCVEMLARRGVSVSWAPVTKDGVVAGDALAELLRADTVLVSVMLVNNETGAIQPLEDIVRAVRRVYGKKGPHSQVSAPIIHTDACQAPRTIAIDVKALGVDMASFDGVKMYGPSGIGALFIRGGVQCAGVCGALHKRDSVESGTHNVAAIAGFAKAWELANARRADEMARVTKIRSYMAQCIKERFPEARIMGEHAPSSGTVLNVAFPGCEGEFLTTQLSERGIAASSKSACLSGGGEGSYVIAAFAPDYANATVRFSFGNETTEEDIERAISVLVDIVP